MLNTAITILEKERENKLHAIETMCQPDDMKSVRDILQAQVNEIDLALNLLKQLER